MRESVAYFLQKKIWIVQTLTLTCWIFSLITLLPLADFFALFIFLGLSLAVLLGLFSFYIVRFKPSWQFCLFYLSIISLGGYSFLLSTGKIVTYSYVVALLIYLIAAALIFMFIHYAFTRSLKVEFLFIGMALIIGGIAQATGPIPGIHDEASNFMRAYYITEGGFFGNAQVMVPKEVQDVQRSASKEALFQAPSTNLVPSALNLASTYPPTTYLPQIIGIMIAKTLNLSIYYTVHFARFALLLFFIVVMAWAIKISPINKPLLLMIGLFPQVIKHASYPLGGDPLIIPLSFLLCSCIIYINFQKEYKLGKNEKIGLIVLSIFISMVKISYLPLLGFLFLMPNRCFLSIKEKYLFIFGTILVAVVLNLLWLAQSFHLLSYPGTANFDTSSREQLAFILSNPIEYIIILLRTVKIMVPNWIYWPIMGFHLFGRIYPLQDKLLHAALLYLLLPNKPNKTWIFSPLQWIWIAIVIGGTVVIISTSLYLQWTPLRQSTIDGIQGRYFLPMAFFILSFVKLILPIQRRYKIEKYAVLTLGLMSLSSAVDALLTVGLR